jgi:hypothetical protein
MIEKIVGSMLSLILLYLIVNNATSVNNLLNGLGTATVNQVKALQGN